MVPSGRFYCLRRPVAGAEGLRLSAYRSNDQHAHPARRTPWALIVAVVALAVVLAALLVALLTRQAPETASDASPSPSGSASVSPEASTSAATGSPLASPGATFAPGTFVQTAVEGVTLREEAGTTGGRIGTLAAGSASYVVDGPTDADGYVWYQISGTGLPPASGCVTPLPTEPLECPVWFGWAAGGDTDGTPWFTAARPDCPDPATEGAAFIAMPHVLQLGCYGADQVTFMAWLPEPDPNPPGGTCQADAEVAWLYCTDGAWEHPDGSQVASQAFVIPTAEETAVRELLHVDPDAPVDFPPPNGWVLVTGAFDHPDAAACADAAESAGHPLGPEQAVLECRTHLVVSAVEQTEGP